MDIKNKVINKTKKPFSIPKMFITAYENLSETTRNVLGPMFYQIIMTLYFKEKRKNKKGVSYFSLKSKDINKAFELVICHNSRMKRIKIKNTPLASNLGKFPESKALEYYDKYVEGEVADKNGDKVIIDEGGLRFLYKNPDTQEHDINPEYYEETRGKRLPWIRHTIENTNEIYELREKSWSTFFYIGTFIVPLQEGDISNYFFIVTRKESRQNRKFVTAYHLKNHIRLLKSIEPAVPYRPSGEKGE